MGFNLAFKGLSQNLHINNMLVTERYDFRDGISTDIAAFRLTDSV